MNIFTKVPNTATPGPNAHAVLHCAGEMGHGKVGRETTLGRENRVKVLFEMSETQWIYRFGTQGRNLGWN